MDKTKSSIDHRELLRKSFDKIRINNPFAEDIVVRWDGFPHVIPANGYAIKERYIAEKYLKETAKRYITQKNDMARNKENERRIQHGGAKMNRWMEEVTFEQDLYANWPTKQVQAIKELGLYGGVAENYGMDRVPGEGVMAEAPDPNMSIIEQLEKPDFDNSPLTNSAVSGEQKLTMTPLEEANQAKTPINDLISVLENKSQMQLRSIAKAQGITTHNTDKKADLIAMIQGQ